MELPPSPSPGPPPSARRWTLLAPLWCVCGGPALFLWVNFRGSKSQPNRENSAGGVPTPIHPSSFFSLPSNFQEKLNHRSQNDFSDHRGAWEVTRGGCGCPRTVAGQLGSLPGCGRVTGAGGPEQERTGSQDSRSPANLWISAPTNHFCGYGCGVGYKCVLARLCPGFSLWLWEVGAGGLEQEGWEPGFLGSFPGSGQAVYKQFSVTIQLH